MSYVSLGKKLTEKQSSFRTLTPAVTRTTRPENVVKLAVQP